MSTRSSSHAHCIEIVRRPPKTLFQIIHGVLFLSVFLSGCLMINAFHFIFLLPLLVFPSARARVLFDEGVRCSRGSFGKLCVLACQLFGPTTLAVSFERNGVGSFTEEDISEIIVKNEQGLLMEFHLPKKSVLVANHQMYADWLYLWCLGYYSDIHKDVYIVLKNTFKWVPIVGWGMQFFDFVFLARSWVADRVYFTIKLSSIGKKAQERHNPFAFIIFPEGTLISAGTKPASKRYADRLHIADTKHTLLPRSTGLLYSLRSLSPRIPGLKLLDFTIVYPGIPPMGYGQSFYTLRSIFMDRVPPPVVHLHVRCFDVAKAVPIGDLPKCNKKSSGDALHQTEIDSDVPEHEHQNFDKWLRDLWIMKDEMIDNYHSKGSLVSDSLNNTVFVPLKLRNTYDFFDAFCFFCPGFVIFLLNWCIRYLIN